MLTLAKLAHLALYGFLLLTPLLGWLLLSAGGKPIPFFGLALPALIAPDDGLKGTIKGVARDAGQHWLCPDCPARGGSHLPPPCAQRQHPDQYAARAQITSNELHTNKRPL